MALFILANEIKLIQQLLQVKATVPYLFLAFQTEYVSDAEWIVCHTFSLSIKISFKFIQYFVLKYLFGEKNLIKLIFQYSVY